MKNKNINLFDAVSLMKNILRNRKLLTEICSICLGKRLTAWNKYSICYTLGIILHSPVYELDGQTIHQMKSIRNATWTAFKLFGFKWPIDWGGKEEIGMTFPQADVVAFRSDYKVVKPGGNVVTLLWSNSCNTGAKNQIFKLLIHKNRGFPFVNNTTC